MKSYRFSPLIDHLTANYYNQSVACLSSLVPALIPRFGTMRTLDEEPRLNKVLDWISFLRVRVQFQMQMLTRF